MILKALRIAGLILSYIVVAKVGRLWLRDEQDRRSFLIRNTQRHCRRLLSALNIEVRYEGFDEKIRGQHLIVANHLSYVDVLVIASALPAVFVTSREVFHMRFLGLMSRCAASLFVERRKKSGIIEEIAEISEALQEGLSVVIFPEGTSSNGTEVLPFKVSLLDAAVKTGTDVLPLCLNYESTDLGAIDEKTRDSIFYYGDMSFGPHLRGLLRRKSIRVRVKAMQSIGVNPSASRKSIAREAHTSISASYVPICQPPGSSVDGTIARA